MDFQEETSELINPFLSHFNKYKTSVLNKKSEKQLHSILLSLYNDIHTSFKKVELIETKREHVQIEHDSDKIKPDSYTSYVFPPHIRAYIDKNEIGYIIYHCNIGGRKIKIIFTLFSSDDLNTIEKDVKMIYIWLTICVLYSSKSCSKTLTVYIYKTPFDKKLPESSLITLSGEHINTAYTYACQPVGEIIVFRKEEWFKVFIHETFHTFGLDFSVNDSNNSHEKIIHSGINRLFPIKSDFNTYEAYTETWARIINCCFYSYNALEDKKDKKQFIINSTFCLELERMFTLYQCNKVLRFMGLQYSDICNSGDKNVALRNNLYRENTNVFAYYIMSAIFMNNYFEFLNWCNVNNGTVGSTSCLKFKNTEDNYIAFMDYISRHYKCKQLLEGLENMNQLHKKIIKHSIKSIKSKVNLLSTTRMTLLG